jgi:hypothetical protein
VWAWLHSNPGDEFRLEVLITDDTVTNCAGASSAGCDGAAIQYAFTLAGTPPWSFDDSKTFYVHVYRRAGATPTCNNFTLRVFVGGSQPW